jgi:hypothetical protein
MMEKEKREGGEAEEVVKNYVEDGRENDGRGIGRCKQKGQRIERDAEEV